MKRGHDFSVCVDRLIIVVLWFIWLCLALKKHWIPLELYVPLLIADVSVALSTICKLYNL